ncbi:MAG: hypothetical protein HN833_00990 [Elusimicrobiaceae bacterium]|jgi:hypothetical protein|nr:hypothetical protein [Elusimicrobiaceae bacterium]MBT3955298.1 hypothetical protein [Elusimicrobiaceae bacterium]MBT4008434.1 hypothetical protein [Elusimicrobiaceae bacterium]MBT4403243.1 hypothetical protein [Elusimicrobiaceae bacterium]MBT4440163.1 hypothetical protein [Elusimicrobiaceae bacterium]
MKITTKIITLMVISLMLAGCYSLGLSSKGEGEYVKVESFVELDPYNLRGTRERGLEEAEKLAVKEVAEIFISPMEQDRLQPFLETEILAKYKNFVHSSHVIAKEQRGELYYTKAKVLVAVREISDRFETMKREDTKKFPILVSSSEIVDSVPQKSDICKNSIYRSLKDYQFSFLGSNIKIENKTDTNEIFEVAKRNGAKFVIISEAESYKLENISTISNFNTYKANANLKAYSTKNYKLIKQETAQASGLDGVANIASEKAISNACKKASMQIANILEKNLHNYKEITITVENIKKVDRLKKLQVALMSIEEIEDFSLERYSSSSADFKAHIKTDSTQELAARILRKDSTTFDVAGFAKGRIFLYFN